VTVVQFPQHRIVREQRLTKRRLALHYGRSVRWVELRLAEGAPSLLIDGRREITLAEFDRWLREKGQR